MSQYPHLYNSKQWKQRRKHLLQNEPLCRFCMADGTHTPATVADHVIRHNGDHQLFYYGELQALCKRCHDSHKKRQEMSGVLLGGDESGMPSDERHHWNQ
jgi:5-methylcytosine-specific restriction endonuclease McrA